MRLHTYHLEVVSENYIPPDVLLEHLAVAMRDFNFLGQNSIAIKGTDTKQTGEQKVARQHPFEGPEKFDDYVPGTHQEGSFSPTDVGAQELLESIGVEDPYPLTTQVIDKLKETRRHGND